MKNNHILADKNIGNLLIKLSIPATMGMLTMALYNLVDSIYVGRGVGSLGLAGISIAFPYHMLILAIGHLLGIGGGSLISRSLGAGNIAKASNTYGNILSLELFFGIILTMTGYIFIDPILRIFGATDNILPYAKDYLSIILIGNIFFLHLVTTNNILRSEGLAKIAMKAMVMTAGLNIILDPIFIFVLKLGIKGAAIATVISQIAACIYLISYFGSGKSSLTFKLSYLKLRIQLLKETLSIGMSAFGRSIANSILIVILNNVLGIYGGDYFIAVYGIIHRVLSFSMMPAMGIGQGLQPIVGYNFGAKELKNIMTAIKDAIIYSTIIATAGFLIMNIFPDIIISIFTSEQHLIDAGRLSLRIIVLAFPLIGIQIIGATVFQAIGKAFPAFILSISRQFLIFIPLILILPKYFGIKGVWISFPLADALSAIITFFFLYKQVREFKIELK